VAEATATAGVRSATATTATTAPATTSAAVALCQHRTACEYERRNRQYQHSPHHLLSPAPSVPAHMISKTALRSCRTVAHFCKLTDA
jgi:hypothetical protein